MPRLRMAFPETRLVDWKPASAMESSTPLPVLSAPFSRRNRLASWNAFGETPITLLKTLCRWVGERWACADSVLRESGSAARASIYRATACIRSMVRSWVARGLHRLQARNPVPSAASGLGKNRTLLGLAGREAQDGRQ